MFATDNSRLTVVGVVSGAAEAAFPISTDVIREGMTLRDYFAAAAIGGTIHRCDYEGMAQRAYELADAMLVEREKAAKE